MVSYMGRGAGARQDPQWHKTHPSEVLDDKARGKSRMRGMIGGLLAGSVVSVVGLGTLSVVSEQPAGIAPPMPPLVEAPEVDSVEPETQPASGQPAVSGEDPVSDPAPVSSPVGSVTIEEPMAPEVPDDAGMTQDPVVQPEATPEAGAPRADTDPLDEPEVVSIEGAMQAPEASEGTGFTGAAVEPVLPTPQSQAPQIPNNEANLNVSTAPVEPVVVVEPEAEPEIETTESEETSPVETFVIDLGAVAEGDVDTPVVTPPIVQAPETEDDVLAGMAENDDTPATPTLEAPSAPRLQLQGGENTLLGDRDTGVTVRRPTNEAPNVVDDIEVETEEMAPSVSNALVDFAAVSGDVAGKPLMSIVLIDDGEMPAAAAALAGLPFPVTIAIDPAKENAAALMETYRADGFEVAVLAKLPEGALPSDVEISFESIFGTLPESIAVLDLGESGLQADRAVTEQAMNILASQGRGLITVSQGLNMSLRAAEVAGVPSVEVSRDLDSDGQDARVVRRFVDQAAFRARQESGVVLVGRIRPDTISALILWGTANQDDLVALVPVSAILNAE